MRRFALAVVPFLLSLAITSQAGAAVVDMNALGNTSVQFNNAARGGYYGVALVPSSRAFPSTTDAVLGSAGIPYVASGGSCADPALTPDLVLGSGALCWHGGPVMHRNETFALTWDPTRSYWSGTRSYVEQFLRDVADGSGTLSSPFALTSQYSDGHTVATPYRDHQGRAQNESVYGGGCIDYGNPRNTSNKNTTCLFGSSVQTGPGFNYPVSGCSPTGASYTYYPGGQADPLSSNTTCLTDAQLRSEVTSIVAHMGIVGRTQPGYSPIIDLLLPPRVEACLDAAGTLCSANGTTTAPIPQVTTGSTGGTVAAGTYKVEITYVTATGETQPSVPQTVKTTTDTSTITISSPPATQGAIGWYAYVTQAGGATFARQQSTPTDIGTSLTLSAPPSAGSAPPVRALFCSYHGQVTIGGKVFAYVVQPWTAMTECDEPDAPGIPQYPPPDVLAKDVGIRLVSPLSQSQLPSIIDPQFNGWFAQDGSEVNDNNACVPLGNGLDNVTVGSQSYLLQREFNNAATMEPDPFTYFGCAPLVILSPSFVVPSPIDQGETVGFDGSTTASTLIVPNSQYVWNFGDGTKRTYGASVVHSFTKAGYYRVTLTVTDRGWNTRTITKTVEVLQSNGQPPPSNSGGGHHGSSHFKVHLQLLPQSLKQVLGSGMQVRVSSNEQADGFANLLISKSAAQRAHIHGNRTSFGVVVGRGTVSGIKDGTVSLRVRLSSSTASKLAHMGYLSLTLRLALVDRSGTHVTAQVTGRY